jgi:aspartyl/asparaginyl-tRNA synthetase
MDNSSFRKTIIFYKTELLGDILILFFSLIGGFLGSNFDIFRLKTVMSDTLVFGLYTFFCILVSFPILYIINSVSSWFKDNIKFVGTKADFNKLRLADGMVREPTWQEYKEHSLTLINETGHDLTECYVMLDQLAWKNFEDEWEIVAKDVYDRPFKWNREIVTEGKINIDNQDRASFAFISHYEYPIYNNTEKRNEITTKFDFLFWENEHVEIGYGSNIRLKISIRGKDENEVYFDPINYFIYVKLKKLHGIPKVDVIKIERFEN